MYLSNPTFLRLVFKPIYTMRKPFNNKDAINNINAVQNLLSSIKLANLIEQISGADLQEMVNKCILLRRLDAYTTAWLTHSQDLEKEEPHDGDATSVGEALKSLSIGVNALKQASLVLSQVNFFVKYLPFELKQLNLQENKNGIDQKPETNGKFQTNQNIVRARYQNFGSIQQNAAIQQNLQQENQQNFQQANQPLNQQRTVKVSLFACPLGCQHTVPWGSLANCENFKAMVPQMRKDSVDKLRTTKCCLKKGGKQHEPADCRSPLCKCGKSPPHHHLICPLERVQMTNVEPAYQLIECDQDTAIQHLAMAQMMDEENADQEGVRIPAE